MNDVQRIERGEEIKNIVFIIDGGIGKVICSTGIVKALAEKFPDKKIVVMSGYPDIYEHNLYVHRNFHFQNTLNFYEDYFVERNDTYVIKIEPYTDYDYVSKKEHITRVWANAIGLEDKIYQPYIRFLDTELTMAKKFIDEKTKKDKSKFVMLQWVGGMIPTDNSEASFIDALFKMHRRSLPQKAVTNVIANTSVVVISGGR